LPEHEAGVLLARRLTFAGFVDYMEVNKEISVVELIAPPNLVGLSLLKSNIREKHNVVVVAIRRADGVIVLPTAEEKIREGDILVVIGRPSDCDSVLKKR
jgi:trk system potassium uptake protein TrkA